MRKYLSRSFFMLLLLSSSSAALAQRPEGTPSNLPIIQGPPGARALGIGGAFIGVADDATAAEANPAGLTILSRPEISLQIRNQRTTVREGCAVTDVCGADTATYPAFASVVVPWRNAVVSAYYSSTLDLESSTRINFVEFGDNITNVVSAGDVSIRRFGVAAAIKPMALLSIGGSVGVTRLSVDARETGLFDLAIFDPDFGNSFFEYVDTLEGSDTRLSYNLGILLNPGGRVSAGAVYKREGDFDVMSDTVDRFCFDCTASELRNLQFEPGDPEFNVFGQPTSVNVPDFYGAGLAFRPFARTLLAIDYGVQESEISRFDFDDVSEEPVLVTIDQEIQTWRAGAEYLLAVGNLLIPLRAGYVRERDRDFETSSFPREEANSYTLGTGLVFGQNQIDVAFSSGRTVTLGTKGRQLMVSGTRRF